MSKKSETFRQIVTEIPFAHRGLFDNKGLAPENSLAACRLATEAGYAFEIDVCLSSDNTVVVFHDDSLDRLCGEPGFVKRLPFSELKEKKLLRTQETIPALADILAMNQGRVPIVIELKSFDAEERFYTHHKLEDALLEVMKNYRGPYCYKSFNPHTVEYLIGKKLDVPVGFLSYAYKDDVELSYVTETEAQAHAQLESNAAKIADFISYNIDDLTEELSQKVRKEKPLIVWTVRTEGQYQKALKLTDNVVFEWRGVPSPQRK